MTTTELLLESFDSEIKGTRKILERVPADKSDYKPHDKSFTLGRLAMHIAQIPGFGLNILTESMYDVGDKSRPRQESEMKSSEQLLRTWDENAAKLRTALASPTPLDLDQEWKLVFGEHVISQNTRAASYLSMYANHLIHHRAQLSVYLRLLDIPVPGLYGPSADEPFGS